MLEYLVMLLAISLVLLIIFNFFKNRLPLRPPVIYSTVGISFALGAVFPMFISTVTTAGVLAIYFGLMLLSAVLLSYIDGKTSLNVSPAPLNVSESEPNAFLLESAGNFPLYSLPEVAATNELGAAADSAMAEKDDSALEEETPPAWLDEEVAPADKEMIAEKAAIIHETHILMEKENPLDITETFPETYQNSPGAGEEDLATEAVPDKKQTSCEDLTVIGASAVSEELFSEEPPFEELSSEEPSSEELSSEEPPFEELSIEELPSNEQLSRQEAELPAEQPVEEQIAAGEIPLLPHEDETEEFAVLTLWEADAKPVDYVETHENEDPFAMETAGNPNPILSKASSGTVNDYISAGFEARSRGNLVDAAEYFFRAFRLNREVQISAALSLEISAVYQELGQYLQARMILESVMGQENFNDNPGLRQKLQTQLVYLDTLSELLDMAKMPNAPYSKIPNFIKLKANLELTKKLKELAKGGRVSEKQSADFRTTGS